MKRTYALLSALLLVLTINAQTPQAFKYQAVIRNNAGNLIISKIVGVRISIIKDSINGINTYTETHALNTNLFGLVNLNIGTGTAVLNTFTSIDWSSGIYFLKIEVDPNGGTSYISIGDPVQLFSVPYALYSNKTNTKGSFQISGTNELSPDSALFEVKDKNGNAIFAVFENGVQVTYNELAKGARGGFTVGGRSLTKGNTIDNIFQATADSIRFYLNDSSNLKRSKGGFAVGGRTSSKGVIPNYLYVTQDSSRIYTSDTLKGFGIANLNGGSINSYLRLSPLNYFIGHHSGDHITVGIPDDASGIYNSAIGYESGMSLTSGSCNTFMGCYSGLFNTVADQNTAIGFNAFWSNDSGGYNTAIGTSAMAYSTNGSNNVAVGVRALLYNLTGSNNVAMGFSSLYYNNGNNNLGIGNYAIFKNYIGSNNLAIGNYALYNNLEGSHNSAIGKNALYSNTTGNFNTALGDSADVISGDLSNATAIGYLALVNASNMMVFGNTSVTRWGFGVSPADGNAFQVGNNSSNGNGAYLTNGGVWTNVSDRNKKENFTSVNGSQILDLILQLPISRWNYIGEDVSNTHIGPMSQDFYRLFKVGNDDKAITTVDPVGISMIAIQELIKQNVVLRKRIDELMEKDLQLHKDIQDIKEMLKQKGLQ